MKAARCIRCVALAVLFAAGCSEPDTIRVQDEPKPTRPPSLKIPADQKNYRTLAVMFPKDDPEVLKKKDPNGSWWFFKMSGPTAAVGKYAADFDKLIESVRFPEAGDPVTWTTPTGWKNEGPSGMGMTKRFATVKSPQGEVEIVVTSAGGVPLMNAQRWWGQLWGKEKSTEITAINLPDFERRPVVNGRIAIVIDLYGPKDPNAKDPNAGGPMMNPHNPHGGE